MPSATIQASQRRIIDWRARSNNPVLSQTHAAASTTLAMRSSEEVQGSRAQGFLGIPTGRTVKKANRGIGEARQWVCLCQFIGLEIHDSGILEHNDLNKRALHRAETICGLEEIRERHA